MSVCLLNGTPWVTRSRSQLLGPSGLRSALHLSGDREEGGASSFSKTTAGAAGADEPRDNSPQAEVSAYPGKSKGTAVLRPPVTAA